MKERPAEFLESAGGFVRWEVVCRGAFMGYESMCVCLCVFVWKAVFSPVEDDSTEMVFALVLAPTCVHPPHTHTPPPNKGAGCVVLIHR